MRQSERLIEVQAQLFDVFASLEREAQSKRHRTSRQKLLEARRSIERRQEEKCLQQQVEDYVFD
ncbi:PA3496 family putative envelope integrity protein [Balneatrix alpica]|uniref:PA3496 family putative envelope integrity protein n=1 Tax=Balneatrix alpica TaxID=75684 RepID=A0ABV5ZA22_9GAMM|nr:hypothetical protein [Balneatrix alpica]